MIFLLAAGMAMAQTPAPPEINVARCTAAPVMDGRLDDPCWQDAGILNQFYIYGDDQRRQTKTTAVQLCCDERWLYLGLNCANPEMDQLEQKIFDKEGAIHQDDSLEIFLDPGTDGQDYYHYLLSFANMRAERRVTPTGRDAGWDTPWRSATGRREGGWTAEIAIPMFLVAAHGRLPQARMNICRNMIQMTLDGVGEKTAVRTVHSSLARVSRSFHEPQAFGYLRGLDAITVESPFLPALKQAVVGDYEGAAGGCYYTVRITAHTFTPETGQVAVVVRDLPLEGAGCSVTNIVGLAGMQQTEIDLHVPAAAMGQRAVSAALVDSRTGELLQEMAVAGAGRLTPMEAPVLDRNYYTTETEAQIRCRVGFPPDMVQGMILSVKDEGSGSELGRHALRAGTADYRLKIADLPLGSRNLAVELLGADGRHLMSRPVRLDKKPPKPGCEIKIDRFNRIVLKNGEPFFPFGIYLCGGGVEDIQPYEDEMFKRMAELGFNTLGHWNVGMKPSVTKPYLDLAQKHNLMVIENLPGYGKRAPHAIPGKSPAEAMREYQSHMREQMQEIEGAIAAGMDHPSLLTYYSVDEPNLGDFDLKIEGARMIYEQAHRRDGYHPVTLLYARSIPNDPRATACSDILGYDVYLMAGHNQAVYASPNYVSRETALLKRRADSVYQPTWIVPLAEFLDPRRTPRPLLPAEQICQTYLAIIHGAKGFCYFVSTSFSHGETYAAFRELGRRMKQLGPIALAPDIGQDIKYDPGVFEPENMRFPDVQAALRRNPAGGYVLLAANSREYPAAVEYSIPALAGIAQAGRLFTEDVYSVKDGVWQDRLEGFGVRAYTFQGELVRPDNGPAAVAITIKAEPQKDGFVPEERVNAQTMRRGCRNVMANPSFEDQSLPLWPKHVVPYRVFGFPPVGDPGALWGLDPAQPFHGRHSLRMTRAVASADMCWGMFGIGYPPELDQPAPYVFSIYMRGEKDGDQAFLRVLDQDTTLKLTADWRRYAVSGVFQPDRYRDRSVLIAPSRTGSSIWLDAMQLEVGTEPTEFTMD